MKLAPKPERVPIVPLRNPSLCEVYWLGASLDSRFSDAGAAKDWFDKTVDVYVINLKKDVARMQSITANLKTLGISFVRIDGVDATKQNEFQRVRSEASVPRDYDVAKVQKLARNPIQGLGGIAGTVGKAAAHLRAMRHAFSMSQKPLALILEDDAVLVKDFVVKLMGIVEGEAPCDWTAVNLKSRCPYGVCTSKHLARVVPDGNELAAFCRSGVNLGSSAILYRAGHLERLIRLLREAVWDEERPHCLDIDVAIAYLSDKVAYYAVPKMQMPGLFTEGTFGSSRDELNKLELAPDETATVAPAAPSTQKRATARTTTAVSTTQVTTTTKAATSTKTEKISTSPPARTTPAKPGAELGTTAPALATLAPLPTVAPLPGIGSLPTAPPLPGFGDWRKSLAR
mmetsp:Transcript_67539/g.152762  ORF Transcript_67539/g.152762 Transcript_67539/m.152762 type:complete len:400 (-) Transcript_67539:70-1269(-)